MRATSRLRSFGHAFHGIADLLRTQPNARIHAAATAAVTLLALVLGVTISDWCWLLVAMVLVWLAEALNTALELLCDVVALEYHPTVKRAKDMAAAAVLLAAIGAAAIGVLVLGPYFAGN